MCVANGPSSDHLLHHLWIQATSHRQNSANGYVQHAMEPMHLCAAFVEHAWHLAVIEVVLQRFQIRTSRFGNPECRRYWKPCSFHAFLDPL